MNKSTFLWHILYSLLQLQGVMVNTFTLNTTDPQFETGRRYKPSLKGSQANVISGLVLNLDKWRSCIRKSIRCKVWGQNKHVDKSNVVPPFEIREQLKVPCSISDSLGQFTCLNFSKLLVFTSVSFKRLFGDYTLYKI